MRLHTVRQARSHTIPIRKSGLHHAIRHHTETINTKQLDGILLESVRKAMNMWRLLFMVQQLSLYAVLRKPQQPTRLSHQLTYHQWLSH